MSAMAQNSWVMPAAAAPPTAPHHPPGGPAAAASVSFMPHSGAPAAGPVDPRVVAFCEIVAHVTVDNIEDALTRCGIPPLPELVEPVLRFSYVHPAAAIRFFRWSGLRRRHTPHAWNLMVDLLGKHGQFEAMWDAIRSMKQEFSLSIATFASAFGSYCSAGRFKEAVMTFDVMDRYGVPQDVVAVNSLLSSICREDGHTSVALDFFDRVKSKIAPDADSFAILLEGWEKEGNLVKAKNTFGEMVIRVGWDSKNMSAYDAFLSTLVRGGQADEAVKFLQVMKGKSCLPGLKFFSNALDVLVRQGDAVHALAFWDIMVEGGGLIPNPIMFNSVIGLLCKNKDATSACRLLDEMPLQGAFPDSSTYNMIFECLVVNRKVREAERFLTEMRKNEFPPTPANCAAAVRMFLDRYDPEPALEVWKCVLEEHVSPRDECANELLSGLADLGRVSEVKRYMDDMLDIGVEIYLATMAKLKGGFQKARKEDIYDRMERRWKARQDLR